MIYLKDNKINKIDSNKIYLKDKVIYQTLKSDGQSSNKPTYLKSAFAYDSFSDDGITDVITNSKYGFGIHGFDRIKFDKKDHYNTMYQLKNYTAFQTSSTREPILKDFKSLLIKCGNMIIHTSSIFEYQQKVTTEYEKITLSSSLITYNKNNYIYNELNIKQEDKKNIKYAYVDFNLVDEQSKILFLDDNFGIIGQKQFDTLNLSTNTDVGFSNSYIKISFGTNTSSTPIDFYYQCYCDKPLSIDEIKEIDKYMMSR